MYQMVVLFKLVSKAFADRTNASKQLFTVDLLDGIWEKRVEKSKNGSEKDLKTRREEEKVKCDVFSPTRYFNENMK